MSYSIRSIRPFIGAKDFQISRNFYLALGFEENKISPDMSVFHYQGVSFYLQDYYAKDWIDNTMLFLEVSNVSDWYQGILELKLDEKFKNVRLKPIVQLDWGSEFFLHDPSGILWHIGQFKAPK